MQKYPIGIQDFKKLREGGFVYIDKTSFIHKMIMGAGNFFLSRPRRFGKSLLVSTLDELFKGNKDLFKDTYIYDKWDWEQTNPVIRISFSNIGEKEKGLVISLNDKIDDLFRDFGLPLVKDSLSQKFQILIKQLSKEFSKVVILIDEYDKPIIDYLGDNDEKAKENRDILKSFYSVLKDADADIRLLFITGISKFTKVSIFSDLNHLNDISTDVNYGAICGISEKELQAFFPQELIDNDQERIKEWYNGYTWDRKTRVYNPFSLLNFFSKREFHNFWYQSGHPAFLWKLLKKVNVYDIDNLDSSIEALDSYDIENLNYKTLLYQTGYITFGEELAPLFYKMNFPNREVRDSFNKFLLGNFKEDVAFDSSSLLLKMKKAFKEKDFEKIREQLNILFASLPYDFMNKEKQVIFHAIIHLTFTLMGSFVMSEVHTHKGRCDALAFIDDAVYCFEFKLGKSAKDALQQIHEKGYLNAYKNQGKQLYAIGVNYSKTSREIDDFEWEMVK
ncbi:MAG: hypothetical protein RLZZ546_1245 [Bacteroidota bacterium]|jgi:hypothetical protein